MGNGVIDISAVRDKYVVVIGLEVHAQLLTQSKAYSTDSNEYGALPNTNISVLTLAHPGTLPRLNAKVIASAVKMGLAIGSSITEYNYYDRKNYFYPDLPKGYQITQDKTPICRGGSVTIRLKDGTEKVVNVTRIHMEEDAGKSMHVSGETESLIDLNRAGVPLIEIVSEPEMRSSEEAYSYLTEIKKLVKYLDICDGNMEEGSLRCDANVSVMLANASEYGSKVEVKNMNSFRNVQRAIDHEVERQIQLVEEGETIPSETRMFDAETGNTHSLRSKESLNDYRYFPEPDLQPIIVSEAYIADIKAEMPALPRALFQKFTQEYGLSVYDASVLTDNKEVALYFAEICSHTKNYKAASNWVMGPVKTYLNELTLSLDQFSLSPQTIAKVIGLVDSGKLSYTTASQKLFSALVANPTENPEVLATNLNLLQDASSDVVSAAIASILEKYPDKVLDYKAGKKSLLGLFMGDLMKATKGKADPKAASKLLEEALS